MLDLVVVDGQARGIVCRNLVTGELESHAGHAVLLCTGGYGTVFYLSTNAVNSNVTAAWRAHKRGALLRQPLLHADPPHLHPRERRPPVEAHADVREPAQRRPRLGAQEPGRPAPADQIPEAERDYYLERRYPSFGNLVPRDVASRAAKAVCDEGRGVGETGLSVYLDFADAIKRLGRRHDPGRYGNLFDMYKRITDEDPYQVPMRIYPAVHYTMGGLWVDYDLMSTIPGLFVLGEANFSDHGANRLGASALMQGLADGYFVAPYTVANYLARRADCRRCRPSTTRSRKRRRSSQARIDKVLSVKGIRTIRDFHRALGAICWDHVGMARNEAGPAGRLTQIRPLRDEFWQDVLGARRARTT